METIPIGSTIGILGGGQLGRMLALAAARLGMKSHIFCPDPDSPAFDVCTRHTLADYQDKEALAAFANTIDVATFEFENIPAETARQIAAQVPLRPGTDALSVSQDRIAERAFLARHHIPATRSAPILSPADMEKAISITGLPAILKTARLGYDGKGQRQISSPEQLADAFTELGRVPAILETRIPFDSEISVIAARTPDEDLCVYEPACNSHENHILATSRVPAPLEPAMREQAISTARTIAKALDYCGVLAVEFFVSSTPEVPPLLVNELAPRVHNSGHWTQNGCATDQFEQHIRAICNWPLGSVERLHDVTMTNLLGDDVLNLPQMLGPDQFPHIYGKRDIRPGRKMGHINTIAPRTN